MPTYEYLCRQCGDRMEVWQSFADDPLTLHQACGGSLRKVFHARGVVFKGSGFYVTDSRKPNPANRGTNGKSSESSQEESSPKSKSNGEKSSVKPSGSQKASSE
ncbi:MAG: hypothetical protein OXC98_09860 [bacterium]|nr:hypothetical protein [Acidimicrobiia bacterium]MCY4650655.1 hypothetical protein [bacterium]